MNAAGGQSGSGDIGSSGANSPGAPDPGAGGASGSVLSDAAVLSTDGAPGSDLSDAGVPHTDGAPGYSAGEKHYLYLGTPDGAAGQPNTSNTGILVFDIDNGYKFVKRIVIPIFKEGIKGLAANAITHSVYYSTANNHLGQFDVETEKLVWAQTYNTTCCDRPSITLDGKKIYAPTGGDSAASDSGVLVINGQDGSILKRIVIGPLAHNTLVSLDGKYEYVGTDSMLTQIDTSSDAIVKQITGVGQSLVWPFTVDHLNQTAYICHRTTIGFDVADLVKGVKLFSVSAAPATNGYAHGCGITPNEKELWIADPSHNRLFTFDATKMPPAQTGQIGLSAGGHGWVGFSMDGRYGWNHTPDVIDVGTKQKVATLKDDTGQVVASSKFIEIHFDKDGKVIRVGDQFGLGRL